MLRAVIGAVGYVVQEPFAATANSDLQTVTNPSSAARFVEAGAAVSCFRETSGQFTDLT